MRKVLFVATVTGHITGFHTPYLKWFKEQGYEVHVASNGEDNIEYCDKHYNFPFARSPFNVKNIKAYKNLKKTINENNYDMVHCHTPVGGVLTRLASIKARKNETKVIYTAHGFHFFKGAPKLNWLIFYPIEKFLSKYTDCLITINEEDYKIAKEKFKAKKTELVHGVGVDAEKFSNKISKEEKEKIRKDLELKEDDFVLIQVGELNKNKNQIMSINAMTEIAKKYPKIHLLIVGKGSLDETYEKIIKENNLEKNVHMLGYREDVSDLMKISNLLLSLSYREGLPVNVIEGIMSGLPIIVTNCRGNRDLVSDKKNGYIVNINDIENLKEKILKIYNNSENIIEINAEEYELKRVIKEYEKIYKSI